MDYAFDLAIHNNEALNQSRFPTQEFLVNRSSRHPSIVRYRGREEPVLDVFYVRGRRYLVLERLSHRGAFRVFDAQATVGGNYRLLCRVPRSQWTRQKAEVLRRVSGPSAHRSFPLMAECLPVRDEVVCVLEWIHGITLRDYLEQVRQRRVARPSAREIVRLARGLAHGLFHYHRRTTLIHGDVSPANIIITEGTSRWILVDFGSAWPVERSAQREPGDGATYPYAAPERLARHALEDARSDMFALGVVVYECLTLNIPYEGLGGQAGLPGLAEQMQGAYQPASHGIAQRDRLPAETLRQLDRVLGRSLALHPDARYATSAAWLAEWDELWRLLQAGGRLAGWQRWVVDWLTRHLFETFSPRT